MAVVVFAACQSSSSHDPGMTTGACGNGVLEPESGEACDGTTDAACASGVGHPRCSAACTVDHATCGEAGGVVELVAAYDTPCARDRAGQITCWGNNADQQALAPPAAAGYRSWAYGNVNGGLAVVLVGGDGRFESTVPHQRGLAAADLVQVAAPSAIDFTGVCGLRVDGSIVCGLDPLGTIPRPGTDVWSPDPALQAMQLFGSTDFLCAVSSAGALTCWRYDRAARGFTATGVTALAVRAPLRGLELVGDVLASPSVAWIDAEGRFDVAGALPAGLTPPDEVWLAMSIDGDPDAYGCGVTAANTVRCWGTFGETPSPLDVPADLGAVTQVAAFGKAACAVTRDHAMRCWGGGGGGALPADRGDVVELRASESGLNRGAQLRTTSDAIEHVHMSRIAQVPATTIRLYTPGAPGALLGDAQLRMQCARRAGGQQSCWGLTVFRQDRAVDVFAAGRNCAMLVDGTTSCTANYTTALSYPGSLTGWARLVPTSDVFAPLCGVDGAGAVSCIDDQSQPVALGALARPHAVEYAVCGLTGDGARCLPVASPGTVGTAAPYSVAGDFADLAPILRVGSAPTLVTLSRDGVVGCAGPAGPGDPAACARPTLADGRFQAVAEQCGVRDTGAVACWGHYPSPDELYGTTRISAGLDVSDGGSQVFYAHGADGIDRSAGSVRRALTLPLVDLRVGFAIGCGRNAGGVLHCFAHASTPAPEIAAWLASIPEVAVDAYAVGPFEVCTVTGATTRCYPGPGTPAPAIPDGGFRRIAVGAHDACGVAATGAATCWLVDGAPPALAFPADTPALADLTVGNDFACGLDAQGAAHCVQRADSIQLGHGSLAFASPVTDFTHLEAGVDHVCGLRRDGSIACFGSNLAGQSSPPQGTGYASIASGGRYSCAARPGGRLRCWGAIWYE